MNSYPLNVITGVNGFIGSNLWNKLLSSNNCGLVCTRTGDFLFHDSKSIKQYSSLELFFGDHSYSEIIFYHCATRFENKNDPNSIEELVQGNFRYPFELVKNLSRFGRLHFVNLNSYWQALDNLIGNSRSNYGNSKNLLLMNLDSVIDFENVTNVFLYDTYGPRDERYKLIPSLVRSYIEKTRFNMNSPLSEINLSYISDIVETIEMLGQSRSAGNFSLSHPRTLKVHEVVEIFRQKTAIEVVSGFGMAGSSASLALPLQIAPSPSSWEPKFELEKGLDLIMKSLDV